MKKYSKKQITEAIAYWKNKLNESNEDGDATTLKEVVQELRKISKDIGNIAQQNQDDDLDSLSISLDAIISNLCEVIGFDERLFV